jgi:heavy metal translocating P-type ATPase
MSSVNTGVADIQHDHKPDHSHESGVACCSHHELQLERWIIAYCVGGVLIMTTTACRWLNLVEPEIAQIPAVFGSLLLGLGLFYSAGKELMNRSVSSSTLAAIAIAAAIATGKYEAAGYLAFILLLFDQALRRTAWGARRAIEDLVGLTPDTARVLRDGQELDIPIEEIVLGDVVRVRAGENLPVDGRILSGETSINQASLTGEAVPVEVTKGNNVYAGTTNLIGAIDLEVTSVGDDTTIGKVASLIEAAESTRTPRQLLIEQVAAYFVPISLVTAGLVWYLTSDIDTAIVVLVVVCPSALLISSPTAMMAAFAAAARLGIMIKQTNELESAANIDTIVLDKTGTLTTGRFEVSRLAPTEGTTGAELLQAATDAEQHSNHPLARSILQTAEKARVTPTAEGKHEELHGRGVRATLGSGVILAGRPTWLVEMNPSCKDQITEIESQIEGMTGVHVMKDNTYLGAVGLEDKLRYNAKGVVEKLRDLGAHSIIMMTGDRLAVAKRVGVAVSVDQVEAECLPEEKHDLVQDMVRNGRHVLMVGDGINDGPSLAAADVGIAMGLSGSDIATNSAGIALMNDDLSRIPFLVMLARRSRTIIAQNIAASIVIAVIGLAIAATGHIHIGFAAFYHFLGDVLVIGNSFRLIRFGEEFAQSARYSRVSGAKSTPEPREASASIDASPSTA